MRIVTMSWNFESQPMRKVNLNPLKVLTNSAIIATEKGMTRARVFNFMGSPNGGGIVPGVDVGLVVRHGDKTHTRGYPPESNPI